MAECKWCNKSLPSDDVVFCPYCGAKIIKSKGVKRRGNGTGTAYKRDGKWTACYILGWVKRESDGKRCAIKRYKGGFPTRRAALEYIPQLANKRQEKHTLQSYWEVWEKSDLVRLSESKQTAYTIAYKKLKDIMPMTITDIDIVTLREVVAKNATTYYPAKDMRTLLCHLYKLAGADQVANADLPTFVTLPKLEEKEQEAFSEDELGKLWAAYDMGIEFVGYILIMIYSGMMPGELLALLVEMIDLDSRQIVGAGIKTKVRKKTNIVIAEFMLPVFRSLIGERQSGKRNCPNDRGI